MTAPSYAASAREAAQAAGATDVECRSVVIKPGELSVFLCLRLPNGRERRAGVTFYTKRCTPADAAEWARDVVLDPYGARP